MDFVSLVQNELKACATAENAKRISSFFKTEVGQYAEKDVFLGVKVPEIRNIVKKHYNDIPFAELQKLLNSAIHEERYFALQCLVSKYKAADDTIKKKIIQFYLKNIESVNNWDLVDSTAPYLLGAWCYSQHNEAEIWKLAETKDLWRERIAIVSCLYLIRQKVYEPALSLAELFLEHRHDLIHKAVGWMLREIGKQDEQILTAFLNQHAKQMPRTMLRYSIEKLMPKQRLLYMQKIKE